MDVNTNAYRIVKSLTETEEKKEDDRTNSARIAGKLGGAARAKRLTAAARHEIAVKASRTRWHKSV